MSICEICTGRHETSACVIALERVRQCSEWMPGDYIAPLALPSRQLMLDRRRAIKAEEDELRRIGLQRSRECHLRLVS